MNEQHLSSNPSIAIVGAGPRGTSLLERIGANLRADFDPDLALDLHIVDDAPAGSGRIWRTDQPRDLCMNTLAHAVTLFTEPGASIDGPVREGPTLYEWGVLVRSAAFADHPVRSGLADDYREELAGLVPESHPSRALYGEYLIWCFDRALALLPESVRVTHHRARAVGIERVTCFAAGPARAADRERLALDDGSFVTADAVVLATGWLPSAETAAERELATQVADLVRELPLRSEVDSNTDSSNFAPVWVRPASPIEQDVSAIEAGQPVIMRGLGMSFFDTLSLLTLGRGGRFVTDASAAGGLRYVASGAEPIVHATSRRGVPFRSKSLYGGLPPRPAQRFLRAVDWANEPRPINFDRRLWPRIVGDAFFDHAQTLERVRPGSVVVPSATALASQINAPNSVGPLGALEAEIARVITELESEAVEPEAVEAEAQGAEGAEGAEAVAVAAHAGILRAIVRVSSAVEPFISEQVLRFDLAGEVDPAQGQFASPAEFDVWVRDRVAADLHEAELGIDSPVKAGLWSLSAARAISSSIGTLGGFDAESRASGFRLLFDVGGMVGSGPPAFRNRQLLALSAAGLVRFIGPEAEVEAGPAAGAAPAAGLAAAGFAAVSPRVEGSRVEAPALVDAWMHFHSLDATADPLASALLRAGRARSFCVSPRKVPGEGPAGAVDTRTVSTGGFDVDPTSGRVVRADGTLDPAVHVAGIPADQTLHDTVISPMPGTDPSMLRETDRVARSAIRIALTSHPTPVLPLAAQREGALRA